MRVAIILASDENGQLRVFGIPSARRLILLASQIGVQTIHVIGHVDSLRPILFDLLPPESFHPVEDPDRFDEVVNSLDILAESGVLVLKANHVVDKYSLTRLIEAAAQNFCSLQTKGGEEPDGIYVMGDALLRETGGARLRSGRNAQSGDPTASKIAETHRKTLHLTQDWVSFIVPTGTSFYH